MEHDIDDTSSSHIVVLLWKLMVLILSCILILMKSRILPLLLLWSVVVQLQFWRRIGWSEIRKGCGGGCWVIRWRFTRTRRTVQSRLRTTVLSLPPGCVGTITTGQYVSSRLCICIISMSMSISSYTVLNRDKIMNCIPTLWYKHAYYISQDHLIVSLVRLCPI